MDNVSCVRLEPSRYRTVVTTLCHIYCSTILQDKELKININCESMGSLVPEEDQAVLEEQYLAHKEVNSYQTKLLMNSFDTCDGSHALSTFIIQTNMV